MCKVCQFCGQYHVVKVVAKCDDRYSISKDGVNLTYIPKTIGRTDYIDFSYCTVCGRIQEK